MIGEASADTTTAKTYYIKGNYYFETTIKVHFKDSKYWKYCTCNRSADCQFEY